MSLSRVLRRTIRIKEIMMANMIKLKLRRIYLVVNISKVVKYRKLVKRQKIEELKLVKVNGVEE